MDPFDAHQQAWWDYCATPWARPLVDAGHQVTVVDTSTAMLAQAHGLECLCEHAIATGGFRGV